MNNIFSQKIQKKESLSELVYEAIREAITAGRIKPGSQLKQIDLANDLGVSQRTVREALSRLTTRGLVAHKPYKGYIVANFSLEEQEEIHKLRSLLEGYAVYEATSKLSDEDIQKMRDILPDTSINFQEEALEDARPMNHEFHMIPVRATGQQHLIQIMSYLMDLTITYYLRKDVTIDEIRELSEKDLNEHEGILAALEARDADRAKIAMEEHIQKNLEFIKKQIQNQ